MSLGWRHWLPRSMTYNKNDTTGLSLRQVLLQTQPCRSTDCFFSENDYDEVYSNIFIGNGRTAKNKNLLKHIGVTHILNTAEGKGLGMVDTDYYFYRDTNFKYLGLSMMDLASTDITKYFNIAADFIDDAIQKGGKVYVHCLMGVSRSSSCVIAYLMIKRNFTAVDAITTIRSVRDIAPNEGFLDQLAELDNLLRRRRFSCHCL